MSRTEYRDARVATACVLECTIRDRHKGECVDEECWGCLPRLADDGSPLCVGCGERLRRGVAEMPALAYELHRGLAPSAGSGGSSGKPGASPDFAAKRAAVETLGQIAHDTAWLAREVAERQRVTHPVMNLRLPSVAVLRACTWLTVHVDWMLGQDEAGDWASTVRIDRSRAFNVIDAASTRIRVPGAKCPEPECGAELWATIHDLGDPRPNHVQCRGDDRHEWAPHQWARLGRRLGHTAT